MFRRSMTAERRVRTPDVWKRQGRRSWVRSNDLTTTAALLARLPSLPRAELARITARMIERMAAHADDEGETPYHRAEESHD